MLLAETAYAKINLALHVRSRRVDGYHELETLFAFVDAGDTLIAQTATADRLQVTGEFAGQLTDPFSNIVAKALSALPRPDGLSVTLDKVIPVAAGLGGGSADAGALFRIVRDAFGLPDDWQSRAARLGADVPACVESVTCLGTGTGTDLTAVVDDMAGTPVLLVNPRVPLSTGQVFAAWDGTDRGSLPTGAASQVTAHGRNDLEPAAVRLCPPVAQVLAALRGTNADVVRMSGSGATCFATYRSHDVMLEAAEMMGFQHAEWWQLAGKLR